MVPKRPSMNRLGQPRPRVCLAENGPVTRVRGVRGARRLRASRSTIARRRPHKTLALEGVADEHFRAHCSTLELARGPSAPCPWPCSRAANDLRHRPPPVPPPWSPQSERGGRSAARRPERRAAAARALTRWILLWVCLSLSGLFHVSSWLMNMIAEPWHVEIEWLWKLSINQACSSADGS